MGFQITGIGILLLFYGCYIMKMISQSKKGIKTDQIGKGKTGSERITELTMKTAAYAVLAVEVLSIILNTGFLMAPVRIAGACAGIAGAAVFIVSVLTMRDSWRAGVSKEEKTSLVTGGIYQISRNPAFLGFDLVYIGIAAMFFNWALLAASVFAIVMLHLQIVKVEEPFLRELFGEEYMKYGEKVCRYLGRK
ncbi:MAG: isoprenylcysteine carboxylmethyltransferase family protein [Lachnospiraceae bacterium]|nr:isoprenylcysteine carboxylmethyltransferase family protein [Lachnospiraceae bacterium]